MIPAISLFFIVSLSALITKVASIALAHTGLSTTVAKFQARSAYTGAGFSSQESEKIMNHPVRRKIIYLLMLVGNAGFVTTMSTLILTFVLPHDRTSLLYGLLIIVVGLSGLWWAIQSEAVNNWLSKIISKMLKKYTDIDVQDYAAILHFHDHYQITNYRVEKDSPIANKKLKELALMQHGITVLGIKNKSGDYEGSPDGESDIRFGDLLTLYGQAEQFKHLRNEAKEAQRIREEEQMKKNKEVKKAKEARKAKEEKEEKTEN